MEPASRNKRVRTGSVVLKCKADVRTTIGWYLNSTQLLQNDANNGVYVITSVDRTGGMTTSQLHLTRMRQQDSGQYSCRSLQDSSDNDTVVLTVRDSQPGIVPSIYLNQAKWPINTATRRTIQIKDKTHKIPSCRRDR